jgi:nicotinic acid mononucleotide adenylyltransferase
MVWLLTTDQPRLSVLSAQELRGAQAEAEPGEYIARAIALVRRSHPPGTPIVHVVGTDSFAKMIERGKLPRPGEGRLVAVVGRPGERSPSSPVADEARRAGLVVDLPTSGTEISSTLVRAAARRAMPLEEWLTPRVARYVLAQGLYGSPPPTLAGLVGRALRALARADGKTIPWRPHAAAESAREHVTRGTIRLATKGLIPPWSPPVRSVPHPTTSAPPDPDRTLGPAIAEIIEGTALPVDVGVGPWDDAAATTLCSGRGDAIFIEHLEGASPRRLLIGRDGTGTLRLALSIHDGAVPSSGLRAVLSEIARRDGTDPGRFRWRTCARRATLR